MPLARIGDVTLHYAIDGAGDWLVLIGGYASGNLDAWGPQREELARTYRVLCFDNRGIGRSYVPDGPYTTRMMANDTAGLMAYLGIERAHIFGKSLGGCIAQWLALDQPAKVRSLAMTSTLARTDKRTGAMVRWWMDTAKAAGFQALFPGLLTYFYTAEYYERNGDSIERAAKALSDASRPLDGFLHTGHALMTHDTWDRLGDIAAPTLLICGAEDIITCPRHTEQMGRRIRNAEVRIVPRTLHGVMTEAPESFGYIVDFFRRHS
jgi:3-oxoadipate enol-lactonase